MQFHQTERVSHWRAARLLTMRLPPDLAESAIERETQLAGYLHMVGELEQLSASDERELGWKAINDDCPQSRERMYLANLNLVVAIANKFVDRGVALAALIRDGNIGLLDAVAEFDPALGLRLSTRASWWIKASIREAMANSPCCATA